MAPEDRFGHAELLAAPGAPRGDGGGPPRRRGFRAARWAVAVTAVAVLWACGPVYIPVPPPEAMFTAQLLTAPDGSQRTVWITAGLSNPAAARARFFIFNQQQAQGVIATAAADGSYQAPPLEGAVGDRVLVYYEEPDTGRESAGSCLLLSERRPTAEHCP